MDSILSKLMRCFPLALAAVLSLSAQSQPLTSETRLKASPIEVWKAWTTLEGVMSFFAPSARLEAKPGGAYELYFMPEAPEGSRGSEGCTVVSLEEARSLSFTWNFPPSLPTLRESGARTIVTVELRPDGSGTRLVLTQDGWKSGEDWTKGRAYFQQAWTSVLNRLRHRFEAGPISWQDPDGKVASRLSQLAWMAGRWMGGDRDSAIEEHWSLRNGSMAGMFRELSGANSVFFEIMAIEPEQGEALLRIRHFGPGLRKAWEERDKFMAFRLTRSTADEAVFEGLGAQQGERLVYHRLPPDGLLVRGEFLRNGKAAVEEFRFVRAREGGIP